MIISTERIQFDYEPVRLARYANCKKRMYPPSELALAYECWVNANTPRDYEWDIYCDIRDEVPEGTNQKIREQRSMRNRQIGRAHV